MVEEFRISSFGNPDDVGAREEYGWGLISPTVNKERDYEVYPRCEAGVVGVICPTPIRSYSVRRSLVGGYRCSGHLPSAGIGKMGRLALRCVCRAHGRSYREKPV